MSPFLDYARKHVTPQDIRDFSPNDPGYDGYVEAWESFLASGSLPEVSSFDFEEPIELIAGSSAIPDGVDAHRYRRFRVLLGSAALFCPPAFSPIQPVLAALLDDALSLKDATLLRLLGEAGDSLADTLPADHGDRSGPSFFKLWRFLLACVIPDRHGSLTACAAKVLRSGFPDSEESPEESLPETTLWPAWIKSEGHGDALIWQQLITQCLACAPDIEACRSARQHLLG